MDTSIDPPAHAAGTVSTDSAPPETSLTGAMASPTGRNSALGDAVAESSATAVAAPRRGRWARAITFYLPPAIVLVVLLGAWEGIVVALKVPSYIVPTPFAVGQGFVNNWSSLLTATWYTLRDALAGFALSIIIGVVVAMLLAQSKILERAISPYATMLQTIPIIAIAPIINILIGTGEVGVSIIAFIIAVFPIISNTTLGLTSVDHNLLNLFQMYNASRWQLLWKLRLPNALPYLLGGVRISSGLAVIGAFVGEVFAGSGGEQGGLGYIIQFASYRLEMDVLFAAALLSALLGIVVFVSVTVVNYRMLHKWHESAARREN